MVLRQFAAEFHRWCSLQVERRDSLANRTDRPIEGEGYAPKHRRDYPALPSGLPPLPYFPQLCRVLGGVTIAIVLTYLEIHHSAPESDSPASAGLRNPPIYLDCDQACMDLGVSRRTLHVSLCCISTWWRSEEERSRAARAGREFLNPDHTRYGRLKFYSATGAKTWRPGTIIRLRRNFGHLAKLLQNAGIATLAVPVPAITIPLPKLADNGVSAPTAHNLAQKESLSEILSSALAWDRRSTHYLRRLNDVAQK